MMWRRIIFLILSDLQTLVDMTAVTFYHVELFFSIKAFNVSVNPLQVFRLNWWEPPQSDALWTRLSANDVYGFHAWLSERLRSLQIGFPRVRSRTPSAPAALPRSSSHLPRARSACCRAFPARKPLSWQRVLWPLFGLRLPRRGERSPPVCLHVLPAQQSQQQQQLGPQQRRANRYGTKSNGLIGLFKPCCNNSF